MSLRDRSVRLAVLNLRNRRMLEDQKNVPLSTIMTNREWSRPVNQEPDIRNMAGAGMTGAGRDVGAGSCGCGGAKKQGEKDREDEKLAMEVKGVKDKEGGAYTGASAKKLGEEYAKEILENEPELVGSGFFGDFWDGFRGSIAGLGDTITNVVKKIPGPIGTVGGMVGDALTGTMKALPAYKKKYEDDPKMKQIHDVAMKVGDIAGEAGKGPAGMLAKAVGGGPKRKPNRRERSKRKIASAAAGGNDADVMDELAGLMEGMTFKSVGSKKQSGRTSRRSGFDNKERGAKRGRESDPMEVVAEGDEEDEEMEEEEEDNAGAPGAADGGERSKRRKKVSVKKHKGKGKRKMNAYMQAVQKARKSGAKSFEYNGKKYVRGKTKTGMVIFRKA